MTIRSRIFIVVGVVIAAAFAQTLLVLRIEGRRGEISAAVDRALWRVEQQASLGRLVAELDGVERARAGMGSAAYGEEHGRLWTLYERSVALLPQYMDDDEARRELSAIDARLRAWHEAASGAPAAGQGAVLIQAIRGDLDRLETRERNRLAAERARANSQSLQSTLLTLAIPAAAIVMLLALLAIIGRILLDPLAAVATSARQISAGTFDVTLPRESRDEIGDMARAFREMIAAVERRQREAAESLARAEREHRRLQATIETVPVGLLIVDAETGRVALQNQAATRLIGRQPGAGSAWLAYWDAFRVTTREGAPVPLRQWAATRLTRGVVGEELVVKQADGRETPILVSAAPLGEEDGRISGAVVAFQDITSLYEVDRLKSEFVSIVSHELRTPLTSIKGAIQLLLDAGLAADADHLMLMNVALANTDRLVRIINDILDISKIEAGKLELAPKPHAAADVAAVSVQNVAQIADASRIALASRIEDGVPPVVVDLDRMVQILVNLLSNALKAAPAGSEVTLAVRRAGDGFAAFSVTDCGPGIPPEKIELLFQKFQQLDGANTRKARGTGLGLAIVKALAEMQGGRVEVQSEVGRGSTFTVTVPTARG
ncbi:MAG TPA: ATP-binding protein [Vicinamibacterales bacterium]|nr:ATP-binding protein [Vicinamibacterales bacterium]HOQ60786.1 ATP-binding protein [Vicinamibacterales bacterium]